MRDRGVHAAQNRRGRHRNAMLEQLGDPVLDRHRCLVARQAVERAIFMLGVGLQELDQLRDVRLSHRVQLDGDPELGQQITDAQVLGANPGNLIRVAALEQRQQVLLFGVHVSNQLRLEQRPCRLQRARYGCPSVLGETP